MLKSALQSKALDLEALTSDQRKKLQFHQRLDGVMLKQGVIWWKTSEPMEPQILVPEKLRARALYLAHGTPLG